MKNIWDAVNRFKAVWPKGATDIVTTGGEWGGADEYIGDIEVLDRCHDIGISSWMVICSELGFIKACAELENWQPTLSASPLANVTYAEYKAPFMSDKKESKPKMVTANGMQYEIGKLYEFNDEGNEDNWFISILTGIDGRLFLDANGNKWDYCRSTLKELGTITPAPVDLVDGKAYSFEYIDEDMLGRYHEGSDRFVIGTSNVSAKDVRNIVPLVPEVR